MSSNDENSFSFLPPELIVLILSFVPRGPSSQETLHTAALVSRAWYHAAIPYLYRYPRFSGKNYKAFVSTICPSVNAHVRKSALAGHVRKLDMSRLVHDGSKSLTARVLGRLKGNLEEFIAPQTSFAINSFAALSKCTKLHHLDLTLVSEGIPLATMFHTLKSLVSLVSLRFPRSSVHERGFTSDLATWPPTLRTLYLGDGVAQPLYEHPGAVPKTLTELRLGSRPNEMVSYRWRLLAKIGPQLTHLTLDSGFIRLDGVLFVRCPNLLFLRIAADPLMNSLEKCFDVAGLPSLPLESLTVDVPVTDFVPSFELARTTSGVVTYLMARGRFRKLRRVRFSDRLIVESHEQVMFNLQAMARLIRTLQLKDFLRYAREMGVAPEDNQHHQQVIGEFLSSRKIFDHGMIGSGTLSDGAADALVYDEDDDDDDDDDDNLELREAYEEALCARGAGSWGATASNGDETGVWVFPDTI